MSKAQPVNVAASIRQRLLNLSKEKGEDFNLVLTPVCGGAVTLWACA